MKAVISCVLLALHSRGASPTSSPPEVSMAPSPALAASQRADSVFLARVIALRAAPAGWSRLIETWQEVDYEVLRVFKGDLRVGERVVVRHPIVARSATAADRPGLRADWFSPGGRLLVFARREAAGWTGVDEEVGAMAATDEALAALGR